MRSKFIIPVGQKLLALMRTDGCIRIGGRCSDNGILYARLLLEENWWLKDTNPNRGTIQINIKHHDQIFWASLSPVDESLWVEGLDFLRKVYAVRGVTTFGRLIR